MNFLNCSDSRLNRLFNAERISKVVFVYGLRDIALMLAFASEGIIAKVPIANKLTTDKRMETIKARLVKKKCIIILHLLR